MVAIVGGNSLGLNLTSMAVLGGAGAFGTAAQGSAREGVYVNASNGNLVIQDRDALLSGLNGGDVDSVRTYNSQGGTTGSWLPGQAKSVVLSGSNLVRTDWDGSQATYVYDSVRALYVQSGGESAAFNTIKATGSGTYLWTNSATGSDETYSSTGPGLIQSARDSNNSTSVIHYAYNGNNKLIRVSTDAGENVAYTWTSGNMTNVTVTLADGTKLNDVSYTYDTSGRLSTVSVNLNADGTVPAGSESSSTYLTTYTYDGTSSRVQTIIQGDGSRTAFTWVQVGSVYKLASVTDGDGDVTAFTYNTSTNTTTVTDPYGVSTKYGYDAQGQLLSVAQGVTASNTAGLESQHFTYTAQGEVTTVTDAAGRVTTLLYDNKGRLTSRADGAGATTTYTYNGSHQVVTQTLNGPGVSGAVTRTVYAASNLTAPRFVISPEGDVTEYRYNPNWQVTSVIRYAAGAYNVASLGATAVPTEAQMTTWVGSQNLTLTQVDDLAYDLRGNLKTDTTYTATDSTGAGVLAKASQTQYIYDSRGVLLNTIAADGTSRSHWIYDELGRLVYASAGTVDGTTTVATTTHYDDAHGQSTTTWANGLVEVATYDAAHRLVSQARSTAGTQLGSTSYAYDADGRLLMTTDADGAHAWMLYDAAGRKVADIDAAGGLTEYVYDTLGNLAKTIGYATKVNVASLVGTNGQPTIGYNANPSAAPAGTTVVTLAQLRPASTVADELEYDYYDGDARLAWTADAYGAVTHIEYDAAGRVAATTEYALPVSVTALASGSLPSALVTASAKDRKQYQIYNRDGLLVANIDGEGYLVRDVYDAAGRLVQVVQYAGQVPGFASGIDTAVAAARTGDSLAALLPTVSADDISSIRLYNDAGWLVGEVDGNGYLTEISYDSDGRASVVTRYATAAVQPVTVNSSLASIRPASNALDEVSRTTYDALGRVWTSTDFQGTVTSYAYDSVGNLTGTTLALNTADKRTRLATYDVQGRMTAQLSADGAALLTGGQTQAQIDAIWAQYGTTYTYDAAGLLTSTTSPATGRTAYFYDDAGRLTQTIDATGDVLENGYDALGHVTSTTKYATALAGTALTGLQGGLLSASANAAAASALAAAKAADLVDNSTTLYEYSPHMLSVLKPIGTDATNWFSHWHGEADTIYTYDAFGGLVDTTNFNFNGVADREAVSTFDRRGLEVTTSQVLSPYDSTNAATTTQVYDAFGRVTRSINPLNKATSYAYDHAGRLLSTKTPLGNVRSQTYDAFGRVLTQTDVLNHVTRYAYDDSARSVTVTTPEGVVMSTTSNREGQVTKLVDGDGNVTRYAYDADGNLLTTTLPIGTVGNVYDAGDRLVSTTDAAGIVTAVGYDAAGRVLTRTVDPNGLALKTTYVYDAKGEVVKTTDPAGIVTVTAYYLDGTVLSTTVDPGGLNLKTTYTYDAAGDVVTEQRPDNSMTRHVYDMAGRLTWTQYGDGARLNVQYGYNADGTVQWTSDEGGHYTNYYYDDDGRVTWSVNPGMGYPTRNVYDANGNLTAVIRYATAYTPGNGLSYPQVPADAAHDQEVHYYYDGDNRLVASMTRIGSDGNSWAVTHLGLDGNGNVLSSTQDSWVYVMATPPATLAALNALIVDGLSGDRTTRNVYDGLGRLTWSVDALGDVTRNYYDGDGRVTQTVAYATAIAADADPSTVKASSADRVTNYAYDAAGRLAWTVDALGGATQLVLDADSRVVQRIACATPIAAPVRGVVQSAATIAAAVAAGNPADPANRITRAAYDNDGRQVYAIDAEGGVTKNFYDAVGNVIGVTQYANRLDASTLAAGASVATVAGLVQADAVHDRTTLTVYDDGGEVLWTVDALGYATETHYSYPERPGTIRRYAHVTSGLAVGATAAQVAAAVTRDDAQDRTTTYFWDSAGRMYGFADGVGNVTDYSYDAFGNITAVLHPSGSATSYRYDAAGRLVDQYDPSSENWGWTVQTHFTYDALGNRLSAVQSPGTALERATWYYYDRLGRLTGTGQPNAGVYNADADPANVDSYYVGEDEAVYGKPGSPAGSGVTPDGRSEVTLTLTTSIRYDAFGDAIATQDTAGDYSASAYDKLGNKVYDVDAAGDITNYVRNAFGDVTSATRYGVVADMAHSGIDWANDRIDAAAMVQLVADTKAGADADHTWGDRTTNFAYDRLGRAIVVTQPQAWVYDGNGHSYLASPTTRNTYDAFGDVVQAARLADALNNVWATTTNYYDQRGQQIATVDPLGYLTTRAYDVDGNVTKQVDYATAATGVSLAGYTAPAASTQDRETDYVYDRADRMTSQTRVGVRYSTGADGTVTTGNLSTSYTYNSAGQQTSVTDPLGQTTYTYYDYAGRVVAVAGPARTSVIDGVSTTVIPLTTYVRDAYGDILSRTEHGGGAYPNLTVYTYYVNYNVAPSSNGTVGYDRTTTYSYDALGREIKSIDAEGHARYTSYDAHGGVAKTWEFADEPDGQRIQTYHIYTRDALGRVTHDFTAGLKGLTAIGAIVAAPQIIVSGLPDIKTQRTNEQNDDQTEFDAFGEAVVKRSEGPYSSATTEHFAYDGDGNLVRSTSFADGWPVDDEANDQDSTAYLQDLLGHVTAVITAAAGSTLDLAALGGAQAIDQLASGQVSRTNFQVDMLGRVVREIQPARVDQVDGSHGSTITPTIARTYDRWGNLLTQSDAARPAAVTSYTYNADDQVIQVVAPDADGQVSAASPITQFFYDQLGREVAVRNVDGRLAKQSWDAGGNLLSSTAFDGSVAVHGYDIFGDELERTDAMGEVTKFGYDRMGRETFVARIDDAEYDPNTALNVKAGVITERFGYDAEGNRVLDVDADGHTTAYSYDENHDLRSTHVYVNAGSASQLWTAGGALPVASADDTVTWDYYGAGDRLVFTLDAGGALTSFNYDGAGQLVLTTRSGQQIELLDTMPDNRYGGGLDLFDKTFADYGPPAYHNSTSDDRQTVVARDSSGHVVATLDPAGAITQYVYDGAGQLVSTRQFAAKLDSDLANAWFGSAADGAVQSGDGLLPDASSDDIVTRYFHDADGRVVGQVDGDGYLTETSYDGEGRVVKIVRFATPVQMPVADGASMAEIRPQPSAADQSTTQVWNVLDQLVSNTDERGDATTYTYDAAGNTTGATIHAGTADQRATIARYDADGHVTQTLPPAGAALLVAGQTQAQVDAIWARYGTTYTYDDAGELASKTAPGGDRTVYFYDDAGLLRYTVDATGAVTRTDYDGGRRASATTAFAEPLDAATLAGLQGGAMSLAANQAAATALQAKGVTGADETTRTTYNDLGRVGSVSDGLSTASYGYDLFGELAQVDRTGASRTSRVSYGHDADGRVTRVDQNDGETIQLTTYDAFGRPQTTSDAYANATRYAYDHDGHLLGTTSPLLIATSATYDARGRTLTQTDALGNVTHYSYDDAARTMAVTTPDGIVYTSTFDRNGQLVSVTDINGATTSYTYDIDGNVLTRSGPDGAVTDTYDISDHLLTTFDSSTGIECDYVYDVLGRVLTRTEDPHGTPLVTHYTYDAFGNTIKTVEDATGLTTVMTYDAQNEVLTRTVDPDGLGLTTHYAYDGLGELAAVTRDDGSLATTYVYDGFGRLLQTQTGGETDRKTTIRAYDQEGRLSFEGTSATVGTRYVYDADGRLSDTIDADGDVTHYARDAAGNVLETIQYATPLDNPDALPTHDIQPPLDVALAAGDRHTYELRDALGRVTAQVDAEGDVTAYGYDARGNLVETTAFARRLAAGDHAAIATAVAAARLAGTIAAVTPQASPDDRTDWRFYDEHGRVGATVDADGMLTEIGYDAAGRMTQSTLHAAPYAGALSTATTVASLHEATLAADRVTTLHYDLYGRVTSATDWQGTASYVYDLAGNLLQTTIFDGTSDARTTASRYDMAGRLVAQLSGQGAAQLHDGMSQAAVDAVWHDYATTYTYNDAGQVTCVTDPDGDRTLYYYDSGEDPRYVVDPSGSVTEYTYDANGRLASKIVGAASVDGYSLAHLYGGSIHDAFEGDNTVDAYLGGAAAGGGGADPADISDETDYTYDGAGRLVDVRDPEGVHTHYGYDAFGDRTSTIQAQGRADEVTSTASFDRLGRRIGTVADTHGVAATTATAYDAFGRVTSTTDSDQNTTTYVYDRATRTTSATSQGGIAQSQTYDRFGRLVSETDGLHQTTRYDYDVSGRTVTVTLPDGLQVTTTRNHEGQVIGVTGRDGRTTTYQYDADGNLLQTTGAIGSKDDGTAIMGTVVDVYDHADRLQSSDDDGLVTSYVYDAAGRVLQRTVDRDGLALVTTWEYDAKGESVRSVDPQGRVTQTGYDLDGHTLVRTIDPDGLALSTHYAYDDLGNVTGVTDANGDVTRFAYDGLGRVTWSVDGAGDVTHTIYDDNGNAVEAIAYANKIDPAAWNGAGNPPVVADATRDSDVRTIYDADNRARYMLSHVRGNGNDYALSQLEYDADGNVLSRKDFAAVFTSDAPGSTVAVLDNTAAWLATIGAVRETVNRYDLAGNLQWTMDGLGDVVHFDYDANGKVTREIAYATPIDPGAEPSTVAGSGDDRITTFAYDAAGRLSYTVDPMGSVTHTVYDVRGNAVESIVYATRIAAPSASGTPPTATQLSNAVHGSDADRVSWAVYDAAGRQLYAVDAAGEVTATVYDKDGNAVAITQLARPITVTRITDASASPSTVAQAVAAAVDAQRSSDPAHDRTSLAVYDGAGRRVYSVDAEGYVAHNEYDGVGRVTIATLYKQPVTGLQVGADAAAIEAALGTSDPSVANRFQYDAEGRVLTATDELQHGEVTVYDGMGQRISLTDRNGVQTTFEYDAAGMLVLQHAPSSDPDYATITTHYDYDALGQRLHMTEAYGTPLYHTTSYAYDAVGRLVKTTLTPIGVYEADDDPINQVGGAIDDDGSARYELAHALATSTVYDAFGEAVASIDYAGNVSVRSYDKAGRVDYDVDAMGGVTHYERDNFGDVLTQTRHGVQIDPDGIAADVNAGLSVGSADIAQRIADARAAAPSTAPHDRSVVMEYDQRGRVTKVTQPAAWVYDNGYAGPSSGRSASAVTKYVYDAFGDTIEVQQLRRELGTPSWATTFNYFDRRGLQTATIDALDYLTRVEHDYAGNMTKSIEYARAIEGSVTLSGYDLPTLDAKDREVDYVYDAANRLVTQTQVGATYSVASDGSSTTGDLTTHFGYDANGNRISVTAALGHTTYSYYDGAGRVSATAGPSRTTTIDGVTTTLIPLTVYEHDVFGNVVRQTQVANGATSASASGYVAGAASGDDRVTTMYYDKRGKMTELADAGGIGHYFSYDADGNVAKTWQFVTENDGTTQTKLQMYSVMTYDRLGHQIGMLTPASDTRLNSVGRVDMLTQTQVGSVTTQFAWDAFGEMTSRSTLYVGSLLDAPARIETFDYDAAGRMWRTNSGDGNVKVTLFDLQGFQTAQLTSAGSDGASAGVGPMPDTDLSLATSAEDADGKAGTRRTIYALDALGRATLEVLPWREITFVVGVPTPAVEQTFDRWGNVVEQSDVRNASYKTDYEYNWNNQVVKQTQPGLDGVIDATSPITQTYYDALGRQVAVRDANGHVNGQTWDAGGQLLSELHADGGVVKHAYDVFGEQVQLTQAEGGVTNYTYDKLGRNRSVENVGVDIYQMGPNNTTTHALGNITTWSSYDGAGNKIAQTQGTGQTAHYVYDARGNLVETVDRLGRRSYATYDALGQKTASLDVGYGLQTWRYDAFGAIQSSVDVGGNVTSYHYDHARQLVTQTSIVSRFNELSYGLQNQNLKFTYDAAGELVREDDLALNQQTIYEYNAAGQHVTEQTLQNGVTYQSQVLDYDTLDRLLMVSDSTNSTSEAFTYDKVGNIRRKQATFMQGTTLKSQDLWFIYDSMNRQVLADGAYDSASTNVLTSQQGHVLTYDKDGNRTSDTYWGTQVIPYAFVNPAPYIRDDLGNLCIASGYTSVEGPVTHFYRYDAMSRLSQESIGAWVLVQDGTTEVSGKSRSQQDDIDTETVPVWVAQPGDANSAIAIDTRGYDANSNLVLNGPNGALTDEYARTLVGANSDLSGATTAVSQYDVVGRLLSQHVINETDSSYTDTVYQFDNADNVTGYTTSSIGKSTTYRTTVIGFDGYKALKTVGTDDYNHDNTATDTNTYDANGYLVRVDDSNGDHDDRTFVNDAQGHVLRRTQEGNKLNELVVNGNVEARFGIGLDPDDSSNQDYIAQANFDLGYVQVTNSYPSPTAGQYAVQAGDTLEAIAQAAYGDSSLWYEIADANGLSGDADLKVGQVLTVPSKVGGVHDNATTHAPYDPNKIHGSTTPNVPVPVKDRCGALSMTLGVVVTVVLSAIAIVFDQEELLPAAAAVGDAVRQYSAAAFNGRLDYGDLVRGTIGLITGIKAISDLDKMLRGQESLEDVASHPPGFKGSSKYDWKSTAIAYVAADATAGTGGGIAADAAETGFTDAAINGAVSAAETDAVSQGLRIGLNEQKSFNFGELGASAFGGGVGGAAGAGAQSSAQSAGYSLETQYIIGGATKGFTSTVATAAVSDHWNTLDVAIQALGAGVSGGYSGEGRYRHFVANATQQSAQDDAIQRNRFGEIDAQHAQEAEMEARSEFRANEIGDQSTAFVQQGIDQSDAIQGQRFAQMDADAREAEGISETDRIQSKRFNEIARDKALARQFAATSRYESLLNLSDRVSKLNRDALSSLTPGELDKVKAGLGQLPDAEKTLEQAVMAAGNAQSRVDSAYAAGGSGGDRLTLSNGHVGSPAGAHQADAPLEHINLPTYVEGGIAVPHNALVVADAAVGAVQKIILGGFDVTVAPILDLGQVVFKTLEGVSTGRVEDLKPLSSYGESANQGKGTASLLGQTAANVWNVSPPGMVVNSAVGGYQIGTAINEGDLHGGTEAAVNVVAGIAGARTAKGGAAKAGERAGAAGLEAEGVAPKAGEYTPTRMGGDEAPALEADAGTGANGGKGRAPDSTRATASALNDAAVIARENLRAGGAAEPTMAGVTDTLSNRVEAAPEVDEGALTRNEQVKVANGEPEPILKDEEVPPPPPPAPPPAPVRPLGGDNVVPLRRAEPLKGEPVDPRVGNSNLARGIERSEVNAPEAPRPVEAAPKTERTGCFAAGTLVHTRHGLRAVETLRTGELVLSQPERTGDIGYRAITHLHVFSDKALLRVTITTDDGSREEILATPNHPFWVETVGWSAAEELEVGDVLQRSNGSFAAVASVEETPGLSTVFNFEVDGFHTYYVGETGVWVHNDPCDKVQGTAGLEARGYQPLAGERSLTREEWQANYSRQRAEQAVGGNDMPLENPLPNASTSGHGHGDHGFQTSYSQQATRVRSGITPTGRMAPTNTASRFESPEVEAEAVGRAYDKLQRALNNGTVPTGVLDANGNPTYVNPNGGTVRYKTVVSTGRVGGFGLAVEKVKDPATNSVVYDSLGLPETQVRPAPLASARVVWEYVPSVQGWRPVTYFPE